MKKAWAFPIGKCCTYWVIYMDLCNFCAASGPYEWITWMVLGTIRFDTWVSKKMLWTGCGAGGQLNWCNSAKTFTATVLSGWFVQLLFHNLKSCTACGAARSYESGPSAYWQLGCTCLVEFWIQNLLHCFFFTYFSVTVMRPSCALVEFWISNVLHCFFFFIYFSVMGPSCKGRSLSCQIFLRSLVSHCPASLMSLVSGASRWRAIYALLGIMIL